MSSLADSESPSLTKTRSTLPATGAVTLCSIFIALRMARVSPAYDCKPPSELQTQHTVPDKTRKTDLDIAALDRTNLNYHTGQRRLNTNEYETSPPANEKKAPRL
jgi:hypothetical protein